MQSLRYLNTVLTIIAILLTLHLWTMWTAGPASRTLSPAATAQARAASRPAGLPNASAQRLEIVKQLKQLNSAAAKQTAQTTELVGLFRNGQAKVRMNAAAAGNAPRKALTGGSKRN